MCIVTLRHHGIVTLWHYDIMALALWHCDIQIGWQLASQGKSDIVHRRVVLIARVAAISSDFPTFVKIKGIRCEVPQCTRTMWYLLDGFGWIGTWRIGRRIHWDTDLEDWRIHKDPDLLYAWQTCKDGRFSIWPPIQFLSRQI